MTRLPSSLERLINELAKLPGIGPKTAQRLAFYLLKRDNIDLNNLSQAVTNLKDGITFCTECHNMAETDPCDVCNNPRRDHTIICVVEEPLDALALDRTEQFNGLFHILGGILNPMEGIGPEQLHIADLKERVDSHKVTEVIVATNPTLEGETTALHISKMLKDSPVKITRIARGLPMGGDLEYADDITLARAMEGRREY